MNRVLTNHCSPVRPQRFSIPIKVVKTKQQAFGAEGEIRTHEALRAGLQIPSIWPLWYFSILVDLRRLALRSYLFQLNNFYYHYLWEYHSVKTTPPLTLKLSALFDRISKPSEVVSIYSSFWCLIHKLSNC